MRTPQEFSGKTRTGRGQGAFTLLELMVVMGIIGVLAVSSVPAIRSMNQSQTLVASHRQVLDDLALARQMAISGRRTVYMVFVPPGIGSQFAAIQSAAGFTDQEKNYLKQGLNSLVPRQYTGYALYTRKSVGDQPARGFAKYLTGWKDLPEGMFFTTNKFIDLKRDWLTTVNSQRLPDTNRPLPYASFRFPTAESPELRLPYVAFNARGQLSYDDAGGAPQLFPGEAVSLTRGSIFYAKDPQGNYMPNTPPDVVPTPKGNFINIRVNWVTGRAKVDLMEPR